MQLEGLATAEECQTIADEVLARAVLGNYGIANGEEEAERFIKSFAILELSHLSPTVKAVTVRVGARVKAAVDVLFAADANKPIYYDLQHLTARSPLIRNGRHVGGAHWTHADNCMLEWNGTCTKSESACCAWRSHSAILFLNDHGTAFEGGEFYFIDDPVHWSTSPRTLVLPCCGVATVFTSGFENVHGVEPVRAGRRVVLASWFTTEKQYDHSAEYEVQSAADEVERKTETETETKTKTKTETETETDYMTGDSPESVVPAQRKPVEKHEPPPEHDEL